MGDQVLGKTSLLLPCCSGSRAFLPHHQPSRVSLAFALKLPSLANTSSGSLGSSLLLRRPKLPHAVASRPHPQMSIGIGKPLRWWEKGLQPNMKEVTGAQDLVESLLNAGDKLVVVEFFSPGCGGCKALHPKICQLAEMNPEVQFLHVNYEEHKSMCYSLNVHVLPFFRFYRGAHGRLCSFSCTNATIRKFKEALAKHKPDRCSLGPPKGLEEKELVALSANKELAFTYATKTEQGLNALEENEISIETARVPDSISEPNLPLPLPLPRPLESARDSNALQDDKDKSLVSSGR